MKINLFSSKGDPYLKRRLNPITLNFLIGISTQLCLMALGFILPNLITRKLGDEALGLINGVSDLYQYVALLEAGVTAASIQALYAPVAHQQQSQISSIVSTSRSYFLRISRIYLGCIVLLALLYTCFVNSQLSKVDIFLVAFLLGFSSYLNFRNLNTWRSLLTAQGKIYIVTATLNLGSIAIYLVKILLLYLGAGIVEIEIIHIVVSIIQALFLRAYVRHHNPDLDLEAPRDFHLIDQRRAVLVHQVSGLIFFNTDILMISWFLNLRQASIYTIYNLVANTLYLLLNYANSAVQHRLGQLYAKDRPAAQRFYQAYSSAFYLLGFSVVTTLAAFYIPFMQVYTRNFNNPDFVSPLLALFFTLKLLLFVIRMPAQLAIETAGQFRETQHQAIAEPIIKLSTSLLCLIPFGLYGILLGTLAAMLYRSFAIIFFTEKHIYRGDSPKSIRRLILHLALAVGLSQLFQWSPLPQILGGRYITLFMYGLILAIGSLLCVGVLNLLFFRKDLASFRANFTPSSTQ